MANYSFDFLAYFFMFNSTIMTWNQTPIIDSDQTEYNMISLKKKKKSPFAVFSKCPYKSECDVWIIPRYEFGSALYVGWGAASLIIIGGSFLCCNCSTDGSGKQPRYPASRSAGPQGKDYV